MAILVNKDNKLLEIACYVVFNPMRFKGMVCRLDDWLWSSYLAMVDNVPKLGWLATDWLLYMIKPERSDFSGFIVTKKAETTDGKIVAWAWVVGV